MVALGDDTLNSTGLVEFIYGGSGNDTIKGNGGDDTIPGGSGSDTVNGNNGNDTIISGYGGDQLTGSNGNDIFVYLSAIDSNSTQLTPLSISHRGRTRSTWRLSARWRSCT